MDEHVAAREALDQAFAQRRRNAAKEAGEAHRTAVQHRQDRRQRAQSREMDHSRVQDTPADLLPAADDFQKQIFEVLAEPATSSSASNPQDRCPSQASKDSGRKSDDLDEQEGNRRGSIFEFIAPKNCRAKRLSSLDSFCRQGRRLDRMQRLLTSKRLEFEQRPETERRQLSEAFQRHDKDASGSLDPKEITACLADLGFKPHTAVECREIRRIGYEVAVLGTMDFLQFVFEMVPRARAKLRELRRGPLLLEFGMFDQDESGHLDRQECMQVLEMICTANLDPCGLKEMEDQFMRTIEELSGDDGHVDFEIFQELVSRSREHHQRIVACRISDICKSKCLEAEDARKHSDELVLLHHSFQEIDVEKVGSLGWDGIRMLLIEYGLLPRSGEFEIAVVNEFNKAVFLTDGQMAFGEFLKLVRSLRKGQLAAEEYGLRQVFERLDRDKSRSLEISEVSAMLEEFSVQPQCWEDQMAIRRLLDEVDEDDSGHLSFEEFSVFVQRVREHLATAARRRQRVAASNLGFKDIQVAELRDVFFRLDAEQDGFLRINQLRKALDMLRRQMSPDDLRELVAKIDVAGTGHIDFQSFMLFFKEVAPVDE
jgi:Ca2+-binding EF-hand superfamily protein